MTDTTKLADELEQDMRRSEGFDGARTVIVDKRIALRILAALRAPDAEPVAWRVRVIDDDGMEYTIYGLTKQELLLELANAPAHEVVMWEPLCAAINGPAAPVADNLTPSAKPKPGTVSATPNATPGAGSGATPEEVGKAISYWQPHEYADMDMSRLGREYLNTLIAAASSAQGMAEELARVKDALRNVLDHLSFHDEEGLIEHAEPMIAARAALSKEQT